ncbi:MAG: glycoside hydrolase family 140 protein [Candidatus Acidiferrum sp.]
MIFDHLTYQRYFLTLVFAALVLTSAIPTRIQQEFAIAGALDSKLGQETQRDKHVKLPEIRVDPSGHFFQTKDGKPFFWLGDTAWQLIDSTTREECSYYLHTRSRQGYTVIQTVVLAEMDGLNKPSALGQRPFIDNDPLRPNEDYFNRVVEIVDEAAEVGLYVALLPTWGDKLTAPWGVGPRVFRNDNLPVARGYAKYLGSKLRGRTNVIWLLGGDRPPRQAKEKKQAEDWTPIWREIAAGLADGAGEIPLIGYHPSGGRMSSSFYLHKEPWLSFNGIQSGHGGGHDVPVWEWIANDYELKPAKPTMDLEPNYEDHPYNPWPRWDPSTGYFRDYDVRKQTYRSVFAGGAGVTYGHHAVWGFVGARNEVINHADRDWIDALNRPAARQMFFLRSLIESRPYFSRIPDQTLIVGDVGKGGLHLQATRDAAGTYALVYFPLSDQFVTIDLSKLPAKRVRAWWYDPRAGVATLIGEIPGGTAHEFQSPSFGPDWVLVVDDASADYPLPGLKP